MMNAVRLAMSVVFFGLLYGLNVFLYRRLFRDVTASPVWRRVGIGLLASTFLPVIALRLLPHDDLAPRGPTLGLMVAWGVVMFTLLGLVVVELVRWVTKKRAPKPPVAPGAVLTPEDPERRVFLARATAVGALAFGGGMTTFGAWRAFTPPQVTEVPIRLLGLPKALDGFTIVQLTDIHVGAIIQERFLDHLVEAANGAKPDLLAITGDLVDGTPGQLGRYVARLTNLQAKYGRYFVSGNHDYYSNWEEWAPVVSGLGFNVLRNRHVSIGEGAASFDLIGVDDWGSPGRTVHKPYDLDAATAGRDETRASVLLAHQPNGLELASAKKIGLQLSGHTHGGQMFPATIIGDLIWGSRNAGLTKLDDTYLYTSRGCGFVGPPVRVGAPPEVVKIILVAS